MWCAQFALVVQAGFLAFAVVILGIVLSNLRALRRLSSYPGTQKTPALSVLVPARNEAHNIGPCVLSLLAQAYEPLEVLVLDDESTDGTAAVLAPIAARDKRLRVIRGAPLPDGWLGKPWACQQLAQAANGKLLLFVDADTRLKPHALQHAVAALVAEEADLLTVLPLQVVGSWLERILVPIFGWGFFAFLPLALAHRCRSPRLAAAVGQFMLFRRPAYEAIGGHGAVRDRVIDDVHLARQVKAHGLRWRLLDGMEQVWCRMYRGPAETLSGFSKNLFAVFEYRLIPYLLIWGWTWAAFCLPLMELAAALLGVQIESPYLELAGATVGVSLLLWTLFYWRFRYPLYLALLYPGVLSIYVWTALRAALLSLKGEVEWKGRALGRQRLRWF